MSKMRDLRIKKGFSQEFLARESDCTRQSIVNIEKGITQPAVGKAIAIAQTLGTSVEELWRIDGKILV